MSTAVYRENDNDIAETGLWLGRFSLLYLGLPVLAFISYWLNSGAAIFFSTLLLFGGWHVWASQSQPPAPFFSGFKVISALVQRHSVVFAVFLLWCALSGTGGIGFQNSDYAASNALLKDLIENPWPLQLRANVPMVYYVCYYLPAAIIGKLMGWEAANFFIFLWTYFGLILIWSVTSLALRLDNLGLWRQLIAALVFIFFGGWDIIGAILSYSEEVLTPGVHMEWWAGIGQYSSNTTLLFWVPQHIIAPWLTTAFIMLAMQKNLGKNSIFLIAAFSFLWSPLASLGLLPFLLLTFVFDLMENKGAFIIGPANLFVAPAIAGLGVFYYSSNSFQFPNLWQFNDADFGGRYLLFILLECLPLTIPFLFQHLKQKIYLNKISLPPPILLSHREKTFGWMAALILLLLPLYKIGIMNDLCMRASIPALMILASFYLRVLRTEFRFQYAQIAAMCVCSLIGAGSAASELVRSVENYSAGIPKASTISSLLNAPDNSVIEQRAGNPDSFFWHWLGPIRSGVNGFSEKKSQIE